MAQRGLMIEELLDAFPISQLGNALVSAGLPGSGSKTDRIHRLLTTGRQRQVPASALLELFRAEALRRVCSQFGIRKTIKADMVRSLAGLLQPDDRHLRHTPLIRTTPTFPAVAGYLGRLVLPSRMMKSEADAERAIQAALQREFAQVATQYSVGGYLGYRIDIDLGNGLIGVEVKLASAVVKGTSEAYRMIGQVVIYDRRRYKGRTILALVGPRDLRKHPALLELESLLQDLGITAVYVTLA